MSPTSPSTLTFKLASKSSKIFSAEYVLSLKGFSI